MHYLFCVLYCLGFIALTSAHLYAQEKHDDAIDPFAHAYTLDEALNVPNSAPTTKNPLADIDEHVTNLVTLPPISNIITFRDARLFVSFDSGFSQFNTGISVSGNDTSLDERDNIFKVGAGVHVNDYVSLEGFYSQLGTVKLNSEDGVVTRSDGTSLVLNSYNQTFELRSFGLNILAGIPFILWQGKMGIIKPYGKIGLHRWEARNVAHQGVVTPINSVDTGISHLLGVGVDYKFPYSVFGIRSEFSRYHYSSRDFGDEVDVTSFGVTANF